MFWLTITVFTWRAAHVGTGTTCRCSLTTFFFRCLFTPIALINVNDRLSNYQKYANHHELRYKGVLWCAEINGYAGSGGRRGDHAHRPI